MYMGGTKKHNCACKQHGGRVCCWVVSPDMARQPPELLTRQGSLFEQCSSYQARDWEDASLLPLKAEFSFLPNSIFEIKWQQAEGVASKVWSSP